MGGGIISKNISDYAFIDRLKDLPYVEQIWLFGSRARGDHRERSDIDLAIVCPEASDRDWQDIMSIIEEADTLLKIDCVRFDKDRIASPLYENILKERIILYVKNPA